jgi:DNA (cytosine-5)-methyltransferase 3A
LKELGYTDITYYASEIEPTATAISKANHPGIVHIGDVRKVRYTKHNKTLYWEGGGQAQVGDIDLLLGGSPCQGFSQVGHRSNFDHEQSQLIYEFERIRNEVRPRYLLLENVIMKPSAQSVISGMVSATPGVKKHLINSSRFCAQSRKRYYWTNLPYDPEEAVDEYHPFTLQELLGPNYEGVEVKIWCTYERPIKKVDKCPTVVSCRTFRSNNKPVVDGARVKWTMEQLEQLQTLPVGYTEAGQTIKARHHAIGNAWNVATVKHLLKKIPNNGK